MCNIPENFNPDIHQLSEAISGKNYAFPKNLALGAFLLDISDGYVLSVNKSSGTILICIPDDDGIYQCTGSVGFHSENGTSSICFHGTAIEDVHYDLDGFARTVTINLLNSHDQHR